MAAEYLEPQQKTRHGHRAPAVTIEYSQSPADDPGQIHGGHDLGSMPVNTPGDDFGKQEPDHRAEHQVTDRQFPAGQKPGHAQTAHQQVGQHPGQRHKTGLVLQEVEDSRRRVEVLDVGQGSEARHAGKKIGIPQGICAVGEHRVPRLFEGIGVTRIGAAENLAAKNGARVEHRQQEAQKPGNEQPASRSALERQGRQPGRQDRRSTLIPTGCGCLLSGALSCQTDLPRKMPPKWLGAISAVC